MWILNIQNTPTRNDGVLSTIVCSLLHNKIITKPFSLFSDRAYCNIGCNEKCLVHLFNDFNNFMSNPNNSPAKKD